MAIVIIDVVACMITFSLGFFRLASFLTVFRWLDTFCDHMIFRFASKVFPSWTIQSFVRWSTSRASFLYFLSDIFETFSHRMDIKSTKFSLCLDRFCLLIVSTRPLEILVNIKIICLQGWNVQEFLIRMLFLSSKFCLVAS